MIKKISFPFFFIIELAAIYFLSRPIIENTNHTLNVFGSRLQLACFVLILTVCNIVNPKYRKPTTIGLMFLYILFLIMARELNLL